MSQLSPPPPISSRILQTLWDIACAVSVVGIWPRFIEPNLVGVTRVSVPLTGLPPDLQGFRVVQFSDLHLHPEVPDAFLRKVSATIQSLQPDLIAFTGDFLCFGRLQQPERLRQLLGSLSAPHGCFAVLGNHDYSRYVGINDQGEYDLVEPSVSEVSQAVRRLLVAQKRSGRHSKRLHLLGRHQELDQLLDKTPFTLLENESRRLPIRNTFLNVCGLGEYMAGRLGPDEAYRDYDDAYPGLILVHNPDGAIHLTPYPGSLFLCGHVHGGQINLPFIADRFAIVENLEYRAGLYICNGRPIYVNRGLGGVFRMRWRSRPEITLLTLESATMRETIGQVATPAGFSLAEQQQQPCREHTRLGVYGIATCEDCLLLVKKGPDGPYADMWDLPGGGIEFGETAEAALLREFEEEVGMRFATMRLWNNLSAVLDLPPENGRPTRFHHVGQIYRVFDCAAVSGAAPVHEYQWIPFRDLHRMSCTPFAKAVVSSDPRQFSFL